MTRASWIAVAATLTLSSFAGVATNRGEVWWPQFRGPNSSGLGDGSPRFNSAPTKTSSGRLLWGLDCRRPSSGKDASS